MNIIDNSELEKALPKNGMVVECINDSYAGVLKADEEIALLTARGVCVTIDVSNLVVANVVKAIKRFCNTAIETGGNLSIIVSVDHPRLLNILRLHESHSRLTIRVNDKFMQALADGTRYGDEENGIDPNALWGQIAHCNIMFDSAVRPTYSVGHIEHVNLREFVTYGREKWRFEWDVFRSRCDELRQAVEARAKEFAEQLQDVLATDTAMDAEERKLLEAVLKKTQSDGVNRIYATGWNATMSSMELDIDSEEGVELRKGIEDVCNYKVEVVPAAFNGRTLEHKAACIAAWRNKCNELRIARDHRPSQLYMAHEEHIVKRPAVLEADVVRFQNKKEKWIAFIGLIDGRPYEVFTGIADDDEGIFCPKSVNYGKIIKGVDEHGMKRYDFQFINKRGFKTTIEGLSEKFNPEFWNYAKLISGVLRYGMPIEQVVKLVSSLELDNQSINNWKSGVIKALKRYLPNPEPED